MRHTNYQPFLLPGDPGLASCMEKRVAQHQKGALPRLNNQFNEASGDIEKQSVLSPKNDVCDFEGKLSQKAGAGGSTYPCSTGPANTIEISNNYRQILKFKGDMHEVKKDINTARFSKEDFLEKTRLTMNIFHNTKRDQIMWFRRGKTQPKRRDKTPIKSVLSFNAHYQ